MDRNSFDASHISIGNSENLSSYIIEDSVSENEIRIVWKGKEYKFKLSKSGYLIRTNYNSDNTIDFDNPNEQKEFSGLVNEAKERIRIKHGRYQTGTRLRSSDEGKNVRFVTAMDITFEGSITGLILGGDRNLYPVARGYRGGNTDKHIEHPLRPDTIKYYETIVYNIPEYIVATLKANIELPTCYIKRNEQKVVIEYTESNAADTVKCILVGAQLNKDRKIEPIVLDSRGRLFILTKENEKQLKVVFSDKHFINSIERTEEYNNLPFTEDVKSEES